MCRNSAATCAASRVFSSRRRGESGAMGGRAMDSAIVRVACALIIVFLVIAAASFADVVFEPVAFALFFIGLVWPLQQALQKRMPRGAALIVTIVTTMAVVIKLVSMVAWGGGQIAQWVA